MRKHLKIKIEGKVQGVSFRFFAREKARKSGIFGFAQNMPDGSVSIEAEGREADLKKFLKWCRIGPPGAEVKRLNFDFSDRIEGYDSFEIR